MRYGTACTHLLMIPTKICSRCQTEKSHDLFHPDKSKRNGLSTYCRVCANAASKERYYANPEAARARSNEFRTGQPLNYRDNWLRSVYKITLDEYDEMVTSQDGKCAICLKVETVTASGKVRRLAVDHDHTTGAVRGLLCMKCNRALGLMNDDAERIVRMASYLGAQ